jgi:hypothetical protein
MSKNQGLFIYYHEINLGLFQTLQIEHQLKQQIIHRKFIFIFLN